MNKKDLEYFKAKLLAEKSQLEEELSEVAYKDPSLAQGWEATSGGMVVDSADDNEVADKFEEMEGNKDVTDKLAVQLEMVNSALENIDSNTYGICRTCNKPIERGRLEANPSAKGCVVHSN